MSRLRILAALLAVVAASIPLALWSTGQSPRQEACETLPHGTAARSCYVEMLMPKSLADLPAVFARAESMFLDPVSGAHFAIECHEVMHDLGYAVEREHGPVDLSGTPAETCSTGFQHGVAEYRLATLSNAELTVAGPTWCDGQDHSICRHLIGHVAMRRSLQATGTVDVKYVTDTCVYPDKPELPERTAALEEFRCLDGAFMEWTLWSLRVDDSSVPDLPQTQCFAVHEHSLVAFSACIAQVGTLMYELYQTPQATMSACSESFSGYGHFAVRLCVYSLINALVSMSEDPLKVAEGLCTGELRYDCAVGFALSLSAILGDSDVVRVCSAIIPEDKDRCIEDANGPYPFEYERHRGSTASVEPTGAQLSPGQQEITGLKVTSPQGN